MGERARGGRVTGQKSNRDGKVTGMGEGPGWNSDWAEK